MIQLYVAPRTSTGLHSPQRGLSSFEAYPTDYAYALDLRDAFLDLACITAARRKKPTYDTHSSERNTGLGNDTLIMESVTK